MLTDFSDKELLQLIRKSLAGITTQQEEVFLTSYHQYLDQRPNVISQMTSEEMIVLGEQMKTAIFKLIDEQTPSKVESLRQRRTIKRLSLAATILVLLSVSFYFFTTISKKSNPLAVEHTARINNEILPGGNRATLTLANGSVIVLDSAKNGRLADQGNTTILKVDDGRLAYNALDRKPNEITLNTVSTPPGGQYMVILADGSKVWLNAASSVTFPTAFNGKERRVEIRGEAYFEVIHNERQPFIVKVNDIEVHDLGTEFNINAYPDEPVIQVTLIKGLANVKSKEKEVALQPGKAAMINGEFIQVLDENTLKISAWKNGLFSFENTDVQTIMRQLSRWYAIDVQYEGKITVKKLSGKVPKAFTLNKLLQVLKITDIHYKIEGNKLTILP